MEYDFNTYLSKPFNSYEPEPLLKRPELPPIPLTTTIHNNKFERVGTRCGDTVFDTLGSKIGNVSGINNEIIGDFGKPTGFNCSPTGFAYEKPRPLMPLPSMASPFQPAAPLPKYTGW